jgi:hypothetical protein
VYLFIYVHVFLHVCVFMFWLIETPKWLCSFVSVMLCVIFWGPCGSLQYWVFLSFLNPVTERNLFFPLLLIFFRKDKTC